jgi:hypothetical protein
MVVDDGKYYLIMKVKTGRVGHYNAEEIHDEINKKPRREEDINRLLKKENKDNLSWNKVELTYGKLLLEGRNSILLEYLVRETFIRKNILDELKNAIGEHAIKRMEEVINEIALLNEALEYY